MKLLLSVIICTHNPRKDYINRVIAALKSQTLSIDLWELLLIDNASDEPVSNIVDLTWHSGGRYLKEEQLGLTHARLRGIQEAKAETIVFVDDDNVLYPNYLEIAAEISENWSIIGAWGGQTIAEFEENPPQWTIPYWGMLGIREFHQDRWSNLLQEHETKPFGAGICMRKIVAQKYASYVNSDSKRLNLDRKGTLLTSCGDKDMALTACDLGLGTGLFVALKLTHLMPKTRLQEEYLLRLQESMWYSGTILNSVRQDTFEVQKLSLPQKILEYIRLWRKNPIERRFYLAGKKGEAKAIQEILNCLGKS